MPSRRSRARRAAANAQPNADSEADAGTVPTSASDQTALDPGAPVHAAAEKLRAAAAAGDLAGLLSLLQQHPGALNVGRYDTGATALMEAACHGQLACVAALLQAGAAVDAATKGGMTALIKAAASGHRDCLEALLEGGAGVDTSTLCYSAALGMAARHCHLGCLQALLAAGAGSLTSITVNAALRNCCYSKAADQAACVRLLLLVGADANTDGDDSSCKLLHIIQHERGSLETLGLLLAAGADPSATDVYGCTPLHEALRSSAPAQSMQTLVRAGASLEFPDSCGCTPLELGWDNATFTAAVAQALSERRTLLGGCKTASLPTPLHRAAACNQPGVLRALLADGRSPDAAPGWPRVTALMAAACQGHEECVRELLAASVDIEAVDYYGKSATMYAAEAGHWHCLRRLLAAGARCEQPIEGRLSALHAAARGGHEACMLALLDTGAPLDTKDEWNFTALQHAALMGREHCVETLLMAGAALPSDFTGFAANQAMQVQPMILEAAERLGLLPSPATAAASAVAAVDDTLRSKVSCPITHEAMEDPVLAADGTTYERQAIETWIARQQAAGQAPTSPVTNLPLAHTSLTENRIAKALIGSLRAAGLLSG